MRVTTFRGVVQAVAAANFGLLEISTKLTKIRRQCQQPTSYIRESVN